MTQHLRYTVILFALFFGIGYQHAQAQSEPDATIEGVTTAIRHGSADALKPSFAPNVRLRVYGEENVVSPAQATATLSDFFAKHKPESFVVNYKHTLEATTSVVGEYESGENTYRVTVLIKNIDGEFKVTQLRFEREEPQWR